MSSITGIKQNPTIHFPEAAAAGDPLSIHTFGMRINGYWLIRAQQTPRPLERECHRIGSLLLDVNFGDEYRWLEPRTVSRLAHLWVCAQARAADLHVAQYGNLTGELADGSHATALAQYTILPALPTVAHPARMAAPSFPPPEHLAAAAV